MVSSHIDTSQVDASVFYTSQITLGCNSNTKTEVCCKATLTPLSLNVHIDVYNNLRSRIVETTAWSDVVVPSSLPTGTVSQYVYVIARSLNRETAAHSCAIAPAERLHCMTML